MWLNLVVLSFSSMALIDVQVCTPAGMLVHMQLSPSMSIQELHMAIKEKLGVSSDVIIKLLLDTVVLSALRPSLPLSRVGISNDALITCVKDNTTHLQLPGHLFLQRATYNYLDSIKPMAASTVGAFQPHKATNDADVAVARDAQTKQIVYDNLQVCETILQRPKPFFP